MKRFLVVLLLISSASSVFARSLVLTDEETNKVVGKINAKKLKELVKASEFYLEIVDAEQSGRLVAVVPKSIKNIDLTRAPFKIPLVLKWKSKSGSEVKTVAITVTLDSEESGSPAWNAFLEYYREVAEKGFPVLVVILILALAL